MAEGERIDWPGFMRLGLGQLRLPPDVFWSMTPVEFQCALQGAGLVPVAGLTPGRSGLSALMTAYPDAAPEGEQT